MLNHWGSSLARPSVQRVVVQGLQMNYMGVFPKEQKTLKVLDRDGILSCPWSAQRSLLLKLLKDTWIEITEKEENLLLPFPSL